MNEKCKYCDYVSKCSRRCEYDSIQCKINRSFPKVVDKSYEQLQQQNKQQSEKIGKLEDNWNKLREWIIYNKHNENTEQHYLVVDYGTLLGKMQELEQGSDK